MARNTAAQKLIPDGGAAPAKPAALQSTPAVPNLDRVIHERVRLGIVSALAANESLSFNDLKRLLQTTDGNISVHARKLEEAGYLQCTKSFQGLDYPARV